MLKIPKPAPKATSDRSGGSKDLRLGDSMWQQWADSLGDATLSRLEGGLINTTFVASATSGRYVLQRLNPIFDPQIHENINAVTGALLAAGVCAPTLNRSDNGHLFELDQASVAWRVQRYVAGQTIGAVDTRQRARECGRALGEFHRVLADLHHDFVGQRLGVHDTSKHLDTLKRALAQHRDHRLFSETSRMATELSEAARSLPHLGVPNHIIGHGDPKIANLIFDDRDHGDGSNAKALTFIDLDTVGPTRLAHELGDAWRSWCNVATEDDPFPKLDLDFFEASARGYFDANPVARHCAVDVVIGADWITLELTARFLADALNESYFGWDAALFDQRGEHNLSRARNQWALFRRFEATRAGRVALMASVNATA